MSQVFDVEKKLNDSEKVFKKFKESLNKVSTDISLMEKSLHTYGFCLEVRAPYISIDDKVGFFVHDKMYSKSKQVDEKSLESHSGALNVFEKHQVSLRWMKDSSSGKFRIFFTESAWDCQGYYEKEKDCYIYCITNGSEKSKPFAECKIEVKLRFHKLLEELLNRALLRAEMTAESILKEYRP